jgi:hypothetical protein
LWEIKRFGLKPFTELPRSVNVLEGLLEAFLSSTNNMTRHNNENIEVCSDMNEMDERILFHAFLKKILTQDPLEVIELTL